MRRLPVLLLVGGALALVAASFSRRRFCDCELRHDAASGDTCRWFHYQYGVDEKTCDEIVRRHVAFKAACDRHCDEVREARSALNALPADAPPDVRVRAEARCASVEKACAAAREAHFRGIAALLPPEQARDYLGRVLPLISGHDHSHAPDASGR